MKIIIMWCQKHNDRAKPSDPRSIEEKATIAAFEGRGQAGETSDARRRRSAGLVSRENAQGGGEGRRVVAFLTCSRGEVSLEKAAAYRKAGSNLGQVHTGHCSDSVLPAPKVRE